MMISCGDTPRYARAHFRIADMSLHAHPVRAPSARPGAIHPTRPDCLAHPTRAYPERPGTIHLTRADCPAHPIRAHPARPRSRLGDTAGPTLLALAIRPRLPLEVCQCLVSRLPLEVCQVTIATGSLPVLSSTIATGSLPVLSITNPTGRLPVLSIMIATGSLPGHNRQRARENVRATACI